ncbi:MAG TPA: DEAD/DEAH box helicase [Prolixibacteraceae bacterium]|nr:DEAD/DEAH box helicase [Prolixibacteraceae bacterium]
MTFNNLGIIPPIKQAIAEEGYTTPTPIQQQAIPIVLEGTDLLGCAQTGTGKTAAFAIPILQHMYLSSFKNSHRRKIKALIVTPTRELAIQIGESFEAYGKYTQLRHSVIFGGVSQFSQVQQLKHGIDILVATPGRLLDLMQQNIVHLNDIEYFVLDEADRMLDMGFVHDVKRIIKALPAKRQSLFFSATMPLSIVALAETILKNPSKVSVTPESTTAETIDQSLYYVSRDNKRKLLVDLLSDKNINTALVFTRTKYGADKLSRILNKSGIKAEALHSNKSQQARQNALKSFKLKTTKVLVATDIASRGIDVDELSCVINYEIPNISETYVHRIGRTGRAGSSGRAISMCDTDEMVYIRDIQKLIAMRIKVVADHPYQLDKSLLTETKPQAKQQSNQQQRRKSGNYSRKRRFSKSN